MRFWITRNGPLPVREQLVRQVMLGIMSEELAAGDKLPSVRAFARQHHIHSNTVSSAYHELLQRGWLELRKGSGVYVRRIGVEDGTGGLEALLLSLLRTTERHGYRPEEVLSRLERLVRPRRYTRILVAEPETALSEILQAEITDAGIGIDVQPFNATSYVENAIAVALLTRLALIGDSLPKDLHCVPLRLRSVRGSLEEHVRPPANALIAIVSKSAEIRCWARAMLLAVGIHPDCLLDVDAGVEGWRDRLGLSALVVTDVVTARSLPAGCPARVFRMISDASMKELREACGG